MGEVHWTAYMTAFTAPVVATIAIYVAWRQWKTAHEKLRLELFDRRIKVQQAARDALAQISGGETVEYKHCREYRLATSTARWLFEKEVQEYLQVLSNKLTEHYSYDYRLLMEGISGPNRGPLLSQRSEIVHWADEQPDRIDALFMPYLEFRAFGKKRWQ